MFTQEFYDKATELIKQHGLDYKLKFDRAKKRLGLCCYREQVIQISEPYVLVNTWEAMQDTVLHEIAHAINYMKYGIEVVNGKWQHHSDAWKRIAKSIGCTSEVCADPKGLVSPGGNYYILPCHCVEKNYKIRSTTRRYTCLKCGYKGYFISIEEFKAKLLESIQ